VTIQNVELAFQPVRTREHVMSTSVAVLGATGVYGRHLVPRLVARGHRVRALARTPQTATIGKACGVDLRAADIFNGPSLRAALAGCDVAINLATALPSPTKAGDFSQNDRVRREGVPIFVDACRDAGVPRIIQQSIAMVHGGGGDAWADEDTAPQAQRDDSAGRAITAASEMETVVKDSALDWLILRGGLFYGPGTGFDDDWFARARAGTLRLPGEGDAFVSLVHVADMAEATVKALDNWPSRRALIVADDKPARWRDAFGYVATTVGARPPEPGGQLRLPSFRVRNCRARDVLAWSPFYRDYREGLVR
jgi:nucleoside-diphosphate-sugar epimerase